MIIYWRLIPTNCIEKDAGKHVHIYDKDHDVYVSWCYQGKAFDFSKKYKVGPPMFLQRWLGVTHQHLIDERAHHLIAKETLKNYIKKHLGKVGRAVRRRS